MRRILHVELDSGYFNMFGPAFFKSFYYHNKGWELYVADLGLTDEQRSILSRYGTVKPFEVDRQRRWMQLTARTQSLAEVVRDDNLVIHLDTDAVVLASFEHFVTELIDGDYEMFGNTWTHSYKEFIRYKPGFEKLIGDTAEISKHDGGRIHAGWLLMRGTPAMTDMLTWFGDNWREYSQYVLEEETGLSALVYSRGIKFRSVVVVDCPAIYFGVENYITPSSTPTSTIQSGAARFVHFALSKFYLQQAAAVISHETYMAWRDVLMSKYEQLPWPEPEDVCVHR